MNYREIPIEQLEPDPNQPRKSFQADESAPDQGLSDDEKQSLEELAGSIQAQGIIEPLIVQPLGDKYQIVAGERRFRASKMIGLETIPCLIREAEQSSEESEVENIAIQLSENIMREEMSDYDIAAALARMREQGMRRDDIANLLGQNKSWVSVRHTLYQESDEAERVGIRHADVYNRYRRLSKENKEILKQRYDETGEPPTSGDIRALHNEQKAKADVYEGPEAAAEVQREAPDGEELSIEGADDWLQEGAEVEKEAKKGSGPGGAAGKTGGTGTGGASPGRGYGSEPDPVDAFGDLEGEDSAFGGMPETSDSEEIRWYNFGLTPSEWQAFIENSGESAPEGVTRDAVLAAIKRWTYT